MVTVGHRVMMKAKDALPTNNKKWGGGVFQIHIHLYEKEIKPLLYHCDFSDERQKAKTRITGKELEK